MKKINCFYLLCLLFVMACSKQAKRIYTAQEWDQPEWENPEIFQINREQPTATLYRYKDVQEALQGEGWEDSPLYFSLNGAWSFHYAENIYKRPANFYKDDFNISAWDTFTSAVQLGSAGLWNAFLYQCKIYVSSQSTLYPSQRKLSREL